MGRHFLLDLHEALPKLPRTVKSKDLKIRPIVDSELNFWRGRKEYSSGASSRLKAYWDNINQSSWSAGTPWSAAFVSYILKDEDFPGAAGHTYYTRNTYQQPSPWKPISLHKNIGRYKVAIGDVMVYPRSTSSGDSYTASHGDVVYKIEGGKAYLAGGNLGDSATGSSYVYVDKNNLLTNPGKYVIGLKKNPKLGWGFFSKLLLVSGLIGGFSFGVSKYLEVLYDE